MPFLCEKLHFSFSFEECPKPSVIIVYIDDKWIIISDIFTIIQIIYVFFSEYSHDA